MALGTPPSGKSHEQLPLFETLPFRKAAVAIQIVEH